ncbi:hypothetical protein GGER_51750 [Serratia rubidaea]
MYFIIKYLHIIIVGVVVIAIGYSLVRNRIRKNVEKEILNNPCYTEATIVDITPGLHQILALLVSMLVTASQQKMGILLKRMMN